MNEVLRNHCWPCTFQFDRVYMHILRWFFRRSCRLLGCHNAQERGAPDHYTDSNRLSHWRHSRRPAHHQHNARHLWSLRGLCNKDAFDRVYRRSRCTGHPLYRCSRHLRCCRSQKTASLHRHTRPIFHRHYRFLFLFCRHLCLLFHRVQCNNHLFRRDYTLFGPQVFQSQESQHHHRCCQCTFAHHTQYRSCR